MLCTLVYLTQTCMLYMVSLFNTTYWNLIILPVIYISNIYFITEQINLIPTINNRGACGE